MAEGEARVVLKADAADGALAALLDCITRHGGEPLSVAAADAGVSVRAVWPDGDAGYAGAVACAIELRSGPQASFPGRPLVTTGAVALRSTTGSGSTSRVLPTSRALDVLDALGTRSAAELAAAGGDQGVWLIGRELAAWSAARPPLAGAIVPVNSGVPDVRRWAQTSQPDVNPGHSPTLLSYQQLP
ncbi:hypothetical protein T492DRAFT_844879 [Pavlovales sp. CCMP2436]|nr:hypothetical protein T492DRAFT_844879 [Pavlovales sp. CCMP2436]